MRTDTRTVYRFNELDDKAQERAVDWFNTRDNYDDYAHEADYFTEPHMYGILHSGKGGPYWTTPCDRGGADLYVAPNDRDEIRPDDGAPELEKHAAWRIARALGVTFRWHARAGSLSACHGRIVPEVPLENDGVSIANRHFVGTTYGEEDALIAEGMYSELGDWDQDRDEPDITRAWAEQCPEGTWAKAWDTAEILTDAINTAWVSSCEWLGSEERAREELTEGEYEFTEHGKVL